MEVRKRIAVIEEIVLKGAAVVEPVDVAFEVPTIDEAPVIIPDDVALTATAPVIEKKPRKPLKSFATKMLEADELIQDRYNELKNYTLRYKKIKSRISKKFDSVNQGRMQIIKFGLAGKTLKLYFRLNVSDVEPKFHAKDVSYKKLYEPVPVMLRVKSGRAVRYAKRMIDQAAEGVPLKFNKKYVEMDYITKLEEFQETQPK